MEWTLGSFRVHDSTKCKHNGCTSSRGWPHSAKNGTCPCSYNIMPLSGHKFPTTLLQTRHGFIITMQGWKIMDSHYWRCSGLWDLLAKWWPLCSEFIKLWCVVDRMQHGTTNANTHCKIPKELRAAIQQITTRAANKRGFCFCITKMKAGWSFKILGPLQPSIIQLLMGQTHLLLTEPKLTPYRANPSTPTSWNNNVWYATINSCDYTNGTQPNTLFKGLMSTHRKFHTPFYTNIQCQTL